jgi:predicted transcriptional regulator
LTTTKSAAPRKALDQMRDHAVRRLVVVNEQGSPAGVLTQTDLSRILDQHATLLAGGLFDALPSQFGAQPHAC